MRYHFGLTQKELAARFDVSQEAYSKWERGLNLPAPTRLQKIAGHFGFTVPDLLNQNSEDLLRAVLDRPPRRSGNPQDLNLRF